MNRLSERVAIVTGASKGIGAGIATALAAEGARVAVNYSGDTKGAERVAQAITDNGGEAIAVGADVSKAADVARLFKEVDSAFGRLDILVNNAGVFRFGAFAEITDSMQPYCEAPLGLAVDNEAMAVAETRFQKLEKRVNEIGEKVANLVGANSAPQKSPNTVLITILSIFGMAVISYWGWIGTQVVAHGKKIDAIILELNPGKALQDISQLDEKKFAKELPALQKITELSFPRPAPPSPVLRDVAQKLLKVDDRSPDYWPTVLRFIQFASAGLSPDVPPPGEPDILASENKGDISLGTISHKRIELDGGDLVDTRFDHSRIIFTEHPVHMQNVVFTDCVFEMPISATPNRYLQDASRMLLASELNSTKISGL